MGTFYFQIWKSDSNNQYYWHYRSYGNHEVICRSTDGYTTRQACLASIEMVRQKSATSPVLDADQNNVTVA